MSKPRITLVLSLIFLTVVMLLIKLVLNNLEDKIYGLDIIFMIIGIPSIFLFAWIVQKPETISTALNIFHNLSKTRSLFFLLLVSGFFAVSFVYMLLFNDNKNANIIPITVTQTEINIGAIQTSAVQTAFAEILPSDNATKPPKPTKSGFETEDPSTPTDISTTETIDPNPETPQPTEPPTELPTDDIPSTETPDPNETPEITPTSIPDPITLDGSGNDIVEFTKWKGPAVLSAAHDGDGDFVISNYTKDNQKIYTLLRKTGYYVGSLPLDFLSSEDSKSFNITASGTWELQIIPLELARSEIIPALIEGDGDDVVIIIDDHPEQLVVDASNASEAFMIVAFGDNGERNLLINATAPYNGTLTAPPGTTKLVITATGPWAIDITAR